ncbi:phosphoribosylformylglycinamidine synthase [Candidatus Parcubacteria bacterium]|nr:phosphoribosylformylglycinamidine synthase [Candidatus Parcubacteria bacterium]
MKKSNEMLQDFYRSTALSKPKINKLLLKARAIFPGVESIQTEFQFLVDSTRPLTVIEEAVLTNILSISYEPKGFGQNSFFGDQDFVVPIGTKPSRVSPWSTRVVAVCHSSGLETITRLERICRHRFTFKDGKQPDQNTQDEINFIFYDFMTEQIYPDRLVTFETNITPKATVVIDVLGKGFTALVKANEDLGANLGEAQLRHIYNLCVKYQKNPTDVYLFMCGQGISEHSRHPHFNARQQVDGVLKPHTLMEMIESTVEVNPGNSISHFHDNSSVIKGFDTLALRPANPAGPSPYIVKRVRYCFTFNGETHNYPTTVNSVPGAETGTGGRVRDNLATGRGGLIIAGTTAFMVGYLFIPGYDLPWEIKYGPDPQGIETPLDILWGSHTGSYDFGNKIGESVICGSTRSHEMMLQARIDGELTDFWSGYRKTIMFTAGIGEIDEELIEGRTAEKGMKLFRFGGDSHPVGVGGAGRSSDELKKSEKERKFDESGVQRSDAIMEKLGINVVRGCAELGPKNPAEKFHDSGAGGIGNCGPEALYPAGGTMYLARIPMGDKTMSQLVYFSNECQEVIVVLIRSENAEIFKQICKREDCPVQEIGDVTGDGVFTLYDERDDSTPVKFNMEELLGSDLPQETKVLESAELIGKPFAPPEDLTVDDALNRTMRLIDVASKRTMINKVDRSVSGLIAQQQMVGPCQLPLADYGVVANEMLQTTGAAISIGEQPIIGLLNAGAMVRMSISEMLLNLAGAKFQSIEAVNICGNWMWAVKVPGEGVRLFNGVEAATEFVKKLGIRINSGKDSLNMACEAIIKSLIKKITSPGTFIASAYVPMDDITVKVTSDIKRPGYSRLMYLDIAKGKTRMGGSVLGRVFNMLGSTAPDIDDDKMLTNAILFVQELIEKELIMAYHDRSDGGIIQTVLEMAFSGNCGINLDFRSKDDRNITVLRTLFNQEAGYVFECMPKTETAIRKIAVKYGLNTWLHNLGKTTKKKDIVIYANGNTVLQKSMLMLRDIWETTGFKMEETKAPNSEIASKERKAVYDRSGMKFQASFGVRKTSSRIIHANDRPRIGILRTRGSNTDREMAKAFYLNGFEPWDINMNDLKKGKVSLEILRMIALVGGFSDGDIPGAGVGWGSEILNHPRSREEIFNFVGRPDTLGFYECNGAQVAPQIEVVPYPSIPWSKQPRFIWGDSRKFESRFVAANIVASPCVFTQGMEGSTLGIWVANGEGKLYFPDKHILEEVLRLRLTPILYADDDMRTTVEYPFNPSGGMCSLCSKDGRHLALMPHVVRTCLTWQWAYTPWGWRKRKTSPWVKFLQNARNYLASTNDLSEKPPAALLKLAA